MSRQSLMVIESKLTAQKFSYPFIRVLITVCFHCISVSEDGVPLTHAIGQFSWLSKCKLTFLCFKQAELRSDYPFCPQSFLLTLQNQIYPQQYVYPHQDNVQ